RIWGEIARAATTDDCGVALDEAGLLFALRLVQLAESRPVPRREPSARDRRRAVEAALWIEAHAGEPVGLDDLARLAYATPLHFLRVFTRVVGATPHQYLIRSRLARACRLLAAGDLPVTEVALAAGFQDLSNFVRTFQRASGLPPGRLKRALGDERSFFQVARRTMG
ncbi:MAG: helix-turn-helix transcriptional regulator, partial [Burkholderiales bacterium]